MGTERQLNMAEMLTRFEFLGKDLPKAVFAAMLISAKQMLTSVTKKLRGEYLKVDTSRGWKSMQVFARFGENKMQAGIDTDVRYMKAHEEGFHVTVQVRGHIRRLVTLSTNVRTGIVTKKSARAYKRRVLEGRATSVFVRPHSMQMNIRARRFMRDTINQQFDPTASRIERALVIAARTGRLPSPGELGA